jgi:hypothetical protein
MPGSHKPIYFLKILDYYISHKQAVLVIGSLASSRGKQDVRRVDSGAGPPSGRLICGEVLPEIRAGQIVSTWFLGLTTGNCCEHLFGTPA